MALNPISSLFGNGHHANISETRPLKVDTDRILMPPPAILAFNRAIRPISTDGSSPSILLKPISLLSTTNNGESHNYISEPVKNDSSVISKSNGGETML